MDNRHKLGRQGEDLAAEYLESLGCRIVERNFSHRIGEIDLVALDGGTVVIVEVKTRSKTGRRPGEAVDYRKQRKLTLTAALFLKSRQWENRPARFDVVEIVQGGGAPMIRHIKSAFEATEW